MKAYTDIEQSNKLAEILPLESADMWWNFYSVTTDNTTPQIIHISTPWVGSFNWNNESDNIPCWSLAALLNLIPCADIVKLDNTTWTCGSILDRCEADNPIDACVEMIIKLHEEKLL